MNKEIVQRAEHYGFDFALSMIKLRGFGETEFWDYNLETFTLMAGLAGYVQNPDLCNSCYISYATGNCSKNGFHN